MNFANIGNNEIQIDYTIDVKPIKENDLKMVDVSISDGSKGYGHALFLIYSTSTRNILSKT